MGSFRSSSQKQRMSNSSESLEYLLREIDDLKRAIVDAKSVQLEPATVDNVVELALLRSFSILEHYLEEIFYLCMLGDASVSGEGSLVAVDDRSQVDLILMATADRKVPYLSWLPLKRLLEAADRFLSPNHPFERLRYRDIELNAMIELTTVRDAVAHSSSPATAKLNALSQQKGYALGRPARYLLSTRSGDLEILLLMTRIELIAKAVQAPSESAGAVHLEPERLFSSGSNAPGGTYECKRCSTVIQRASYGAMAVCAACTSQSPCPTCGQTQRASSQWVRHPRK